MAGNTRGANGRGEGNTNDPMAGQMAAMVRLLEQQQAMQQRQQEFMEQCLGQMAVAAEAAVPKDQAWSKFLKHHPPQRYLRRRCC